MSKQKNICIFLYFLPIFGNYNETGTCKWILSASKLIIENYSENFSVQSKELRFYLLFEI